MKILALNPELYAMTYEGLLSGTTRGVENRVLAKIQIKLEAVGKAKDGSLLFELIGDSAIIELEDAEFTLAKRILDAVEWNNVSAKKAAKLYDFIDAVPSKEQYEALKVGVLKLVEPNTDASKPGATAKS